MMTFISIFIKLVLDFFIGLAVLRFSKVERTFIETVIYALCLGFYLETVIEFIFLWCGTSLAFSLSVLSVVTVLAITWLFFKKNITFPSIRIIKPRWYEWLLGVLIAEKFFFALWQLVFTPTFFEDALTHWSGRSRMLYGAVNWSFDPHSPVFLGYFGERKYPLFTPIWRATTATINGSWNEVISRADSLIFFIILILTIWAGVYRLTKNRWLSAVSAYILSALPLLVWHAAAGFNDVAIAVFALSSLLAIARRDWLVAGLLAAGSAWCKNDGLAVWIPALLVAAGVINLSGSSNEKNIPWLKDRIKPCLLFVLGIATLTPWVLFNLIHQLGFSASGLSLKLQWHPEGPKQFWSKVIFGPTHGVFWLFILVVIAAMLVQLWTDQVGRAMLAVNIFIFVSLLSIYFFTGSIDWLNNEMTIHRSMLQFAPIALTTAAYGCSLTLSKRAHFKHTPSQSPEEKTHRSNDLVSY